jgi:hypothetical protein
MHLSRIRPALLALVAIATLATVGSPVAEAAPRHRLYHKAEQARPAKWCGWFMAQHFGITGELNRFLWRARNWASVGTPVSEPRVGAVVVWRHHVGKITAIDGRRIRVLSGNDSKAVRDRWRSTAGVIAYRIFEPPNSWASI